MSREREEACLLFQELLGLGYSHSSHVIKSQPTPLLAAPIFDTFTLLCIKMGLRGFSRAPPILTTHPRVSLGWPTFVPCAPAQLLILHPCTYFLLLF